MRPVLLTAALVLAATPGAARNREIIPAATPAGPPRSCLPTFQIRESRVRTDQVIDFITRSGKVYRNTLAVPCANLGFERRFTYTTSTSQLCSSDIITVLYETTPIPGASCGLGEFQPVTLAKRDR